MLPLLILMMLFAFLAMGAFVFVLRATAPPLRKYSLSAALWCATLGPCSVVWTVGAGLALVANGIAMQAAQTRSIHLPELPKGIGPGYIVFGLVGSLFTATVVAWVHQKAIRQMTFALFRIYAGLVAGGIGTVWGWCLGFWLLLNTQLHYRFALWGLAMAALCGGFGYTGFHWARLLRSKSPTIPGLVSQAEFEGLG
jgi:hypothetical protein